MPKPELIARQSGHPRGLLGHLVARIMALDTASTNRRVQRALESKPGEDILELGCGHGRTLGRLAHQVGHGHVAGVDPSEVMLRVARRHNRRQIRAGQVSVERGDSAHIPWPDASFDKVVSVHTLYFWPDLDAGLREIRRVLRPGGELLLAFHSGDEPEVRAKLPATVYALRGDGAVAEALASAGYREVAVTRESDTPLRLARARA